MTAPEPIRVAITLEQCWHRVPGGTATSVLDLVRELKDRPELDLIGVSARHRSPPPEPFVPPVRVAQLPLPRPALYESWHGLRRPAVQRATGPVDVIHATAVAVPPKTAPLVVTVHDLAFLAGADQPTGHGLRFFRRGLALTRRDADLVLCPSDATRQECVAAGIDPGRIRVVPWGVHPVEVPATEQHEVRRRHGVERPYVLFCGTVEPRKNLAGIVQAFALVAPAHPEVDLVLVGPSGWNEDLGALIAEAGIGDRTRALGFVSEADKQALYSGAAAFCYPSLREGFGLPVLEAMAQGTPVVTSAGSATAEVAGAAALLVDPHAPDAIAQGLAAILDDQHLAGDLARRGRARAGEFPWSRTTDLTIEAYQEAAVDGEHLVDGERLRRSLAARRWRFPRSRAEPVAAAAQPSDGERLRRSLAARRWRFPHWRGGPVSNAAQPPGGAASRAWVSWRSQARRARMGEWAQQTQPPGGAAPEAWVSWRSQARRARMGEWAQQAQPPGGAAPEAWVSWRSQPRRARKGERDQQTQPQANIAVNLLWLVPGVVGGSEEYLTRSLLGVARAAPPDIQLTLFVLEPFLAAHPDLAHAFPTVAWAGDGRSKVRRVVAENTWLASQVGEGGFDLVHHGGGVVPPRGAAPSVLTIHDLQPLVLPGNFHPVKRQYLSWMLPRSAARARLVLTPSHHVGRTVVDLLGVPEDRVRTVPHGAEPVGAVPRERAAAAAVACNRHGITGRYFLLPGITYPHKNHVMLVQAFAAVAAARTDVQLVLTGGGGPVEPAVIEEVARLGLTRQVHRLGRVPREDLDALFDGAVALTFPSRFEGFGAPALEAMSRGCPVIASHAASLPEVLDGAGVLLSPDDLEGWTDAMISLLDHPEERDRLVAAGLRRAETFTLRRSGEALLDAYGDALGGGHGR